MVKRIAFLTDNADPLAPLGGHEAGGENVYVLEMCRALGRLGWTVDIFVRWSYPKTAQIAKISENVRVIRLVAGELKFIPKEKLMPYMSEYVASFLAFKEKNKLDYLLVHGNYYNSGWAAVEIAKQLGIVAVNTFHTLGIVKREALGSYDPSSEDRISVEKMIMEKMDRLIATSPQMKDELTRLYGQSPKKIAVIAEGANLKRFIPIQQHLARRVLHIALNRTIVLYVGRIERRKGIDTLLGAMARVVELMPERRKTLRVYISGGEPKRKWKSEMPVVKEERDRLVSIAKQLKIEDMVRFIGGIDRENLPYYYSASDVTVVPSYYEPFGLVPLESMACGCPVIASRVGGLQFTIKEGKTGYLVPSRDTNAFAEKIAFLISHPTIRKTMRENGIDRVKHMFSWDAVGKEMSTFYHDILIEFLYRKTQGKHGLKVL